jgi:hypothetical protein
VVFLLFISHRNNEKTKILCAKIAQKRETEDERVEKRHGSFVVSLKKGHAHAPNSFFIGNFAATK